MHTTNQMLNDYNSIISSRKVLNSSNSILTLFPYYKNGIWMFDDERTGLREEPFVAGADLFIEFILSQLGLLPRARNIFAAIFSKLPFPGHHAQLTYTTHRDMGTIYSTSCEDFKNHQGTNELWLCPALNLYFKESPQHLFLQCKGIINQE